MSVTERIQAVRLIEKMEKSPVYAQKLGLKNKSKFTKEGVNRGC